MDMFLKNNKFFIKKEKRIRRIEDIHFSRPKIKRNKWVTFVAEYIDASIRNIRLLAKLSKRIVAVVPSSISVLLLTLSIMVVTVIAAPPTSKYNLGETLDPDCSPGDTNCAVVAPAASGANSDITSLSGLLTALSISQGGLGMSTAPSYGELLIGQSDGSYALQATSTLGIKAIDVYGMTGTSTATTDTLEYLYQLKEFSGLSKTIGWTKYYFNA